MIRQSTIRRIHNSANRCKFYRILTIFFFLCFSSSHLTAMQYDKCSGVELETVSNYAQDSNHVFLPNIYSSEKSDSKGLSGKYLLKLITESISDNNIKTLTYALRQPGISKIIKDLFQNHSGNYKGEYIYQLFPNIDTKRPAFLKLLNNFFDISSLITELSSATIKKIYIDKKSGAILMDEAEDAISIIRHAVCEGYYDFVEGLLTLHAIPRSEQRLLTFAIVNCRPRIVSLLLSYPPIAKALDKNQRENLLRLVDKKIKDLTKICKNKKHFKPRLKRFNTIRKMLQVTTKNNSKHKKIEV